MAAGREPPTLAGKLSTYAHLVAAQVRSQAQYRVSFALDIVISALTALIDISGVLVVFLVTPALGGFAPAEVCLMSGLAMTGFGIADLVVGNTERLRHYVRTGLFDVVLIRPLGTLPQLVAIDFAPRRVGRLTSSVVLLVVAALWADVAWTPAKIAVAVLSIASGAVLFGSLFVAGATVAFWWIESGEVANAVTYGGETFTEYPVTIYSGWFRRLFAYALGFGFVAYYPALVLLGRSDPLGAPDFVRWLGPLVALVAATAAAALWRTGVRHYRSTGS